MAGSRLCLEVRETFLQQGRSLFPSYFQATKSKLRGPESSSAFSRLLFPANSTLPQGVSGYKWKLYARTHFLLFSSSGYSIARTYLFDEHTGGKRKTFPFLCILTRNSPSPTINIPRAVLLLTACKFHKLGLLTASSSSSVGMH